MEGHGTVRPGNGDGLDFSTLGQHPSQQQQLNSSVGFGPATHFPHHINPVMDATSVFPSILAVGGVPPSLYPSISTTHNTLMEPLQAGVGLPTQTLFAALLSIQQRTHQIQALVQLMMGVGGGGGGAPSQFAPSIASLISELVVTATGMLQQFSVSLPEVIAGDLHLHSPSLSLPLAEQGLFPAAELLRMGNYSSSSSSPFFNGPNLGSTSCSFPDDGLDDPPAGLLNIGNPPHVNGGRRKVDEYGNRDRNGDGDHGLGDGNGDGDHVLGDGSGDGDHGLGDGIEDGDHGLGDGVRERERRWDPESDEEDEAAGSYELIEMAEFEILAEHTHFCGVCGKGFKRDANLRMHMRGHGDEYKTPAALARPAPPPSGLIPLAGSPAGGSHLRPRRYSCPSDGCKRNKRHRKFRPLKTLLCVKNHYRRSHCPKVLVCAKCGNKRFSVLADLKTHEKHCGCEKWQCSCGTTFSRKDKLFGHVSLFSAGHFPNPPITSNTNTTATTTIPLSPSAPHNPPFPIPSVAPPSFHDFPPVLFHQNSNPFRPKLLSHCDELTPDLFVHHAK